MNENEEIAAVEDKPLSIIESVLVETKFVRNQVFLHVQVCVEGEWYDAFYDVNDSRIHKEYTALELNAAVERRQAERQAERQARGL